MMLVMTDDCVCKVSEATTSQKSAVMVCYVPHGSLFHSFCTITCKVMFV
jgi:hypothetical protein